MYITEKLKKMKSRSTLIVFIFILFSSVIFKPEYLSAQVTDSENMSADNIVYWFNINLRIMEDPETRIKSYDVRRASSKVDAGSIAEYDEKLWSSLSKGGLIPIGPFYRYDEAKQAMKFYNVGQDEKQDSLFNDDRQVFWFILHVKKRPRSGSWELVRKPGAIASGDYETFKSFLEGNLKLQVFTIGPFWDQPEAEESKRRYRLH